MTNFLPIPGSVLWACQSCGTAVGVMDRAKHEEWHSVLKRKLKSPAMAGLPLRISFAERSS